MNDELVQGSRFKVQGSTFKVIAAQIILIIRGILNYGNRTVVGGRLSMVKL